MAEIIAWFLIFAMILCCFVISNIVGTFVGNFLVFTILFYKKDSVYNNPLEEKKPYLSVVPKDALNSSIVALKRSFNAFFRRKEPLYKHRVIYKLDIHALFKEKVRLSKNDEKTTFRLLVSWLNENVGFSMYKLDTDFKFGEEYDISEWSMTYIIDFFRKDDAMLFKLTWC